ncbi:hypothetical protein ACHAWF_018710 [Thalassiosira exigua]
MFLLFGMIGTALFAAKGMFHLSLGNLLRTMFGHGHSKSSVVAVCPSNENTGDQMTVESMIPHKTAIENLHLDRAAPYFHKTLTNVDDIVSSGFLWNDEDAGMTKWRPQGVTTFHTTGGRRFVLVSWYGRKDEGYSDRGGRVSLIDITGMPRNESSPDFPYCHVLLVDSNFCTLPEIHVGGIEQQNGTLFVADSRKGRQSILEFDIANGLFGLPPEMRSSMFGHRYVLRQSSSFASPTKPSFISYDVSSGKFVVGTYSRCGKKVGVHLDSTNCFDRPNNRLVWFDKSHAESNGTSTCWHYFSEMQGATSAKVGTDTIIWVSSSYGPLGESHLHVVRASSAVNYECPLNDIDLESVRILSFPPGLEDLHIEQTERGRYLWSVTEFGTRMVLSTPLENLLPQ